MSQNPNILVCAPNLLAIESSFHVGGGGGGIYLYILFGMKKSKKKSCQRAGLSQYYFGVRHLIIRASF